MLTKNQIGIALSILIVVGIGAMAYIWPSENPRGLTLPVETTNTSSPIRPVGPTDHIRGSISAPIVVVEYSDMECPFCKRFHNSMKEVYATRGQTGQMAWVFRHFPIDALHQKARAEAHATECASELGGNDAFWQMLDRIYSETNSNDSLDLELLPDFAVTIGLDQAEFVACIESNRHMTKIQADYQNATESGGTGTPFPVVINQETGESVVLPGAVPTSEILSAIDSLIK